MYIHTDMKVNVYHGKPWQILRGVCFSGSPINRLLTIKQSMLIG